MFNTKHTPFNSRVIFTQQSNISRLEVVFNKTFTDDVDALEGYKKQIEDAASTIIQLIDKKIEFTNKITTYDNGKNNRKN